MTQNTLTKTRTDGLVARIAGRDPAALAELHRTLGPQVRTTICSVLRDPDQIRAVVAATFLEVWNVAPTTRHDPADADAWISTIAVTRATDRAAADAATDTSLRDIAMVHDRSYRLELHRRIGSGPASG